MNRTFLFLHLKYASRPKNCRGLSESQMEVYMLLRPVVEVIEMSRRQNNRLEDGLLRITSLFR